jgi:hypothetical protein
VLVDLYVFAESVDIIKDVRFKKANDMFQAMSVDLKRKELDNIEYTEVFEEDPVLNSVSIIFTCVSINGTDKF